MINTNCSPITDIFQTNRTTMLEICEELAEVENLKVTIKESTKGAFIAGSGAFVGALLGGPIGLAIGGTIGSVTGAVSCRRFRPVADILRNDLTAAQKHKLTNAVRKVISNIRLEHGVALLTLVLTSPALKEAVLMELTSFFYKELSYSIA